MEEDKNIKGKQNNKLKGKNPHLIILDDPLYEQDIIRTKMAIANNKTIDYPVIVWDAKDRNKKQFQETILQQKDLAIGIGFEIKDYEIQKRKVWYKPWTWLLKPIKVIKDFTLKNVSLIKGDGNGSRKR